MKTFVIFACVFVVLASCASIDRFESEKPQVTVIDLRGAPSDRIAESNVDAVDVEQEEDYDSEEYEDYVSGLEELELPIVALSSKPKDPSVVLDTDRNGGVKTKGKGRKQGKGKGKGRKKNPCLRKYKSYCIHGTCQYVKELHAPSCICNAGYSGERCHVLDIIPMSTTNVEGSYDRTTALAIMAVVLSSLCLTVIGILLAMRFHKRGAYNVENEEKVKLGLEPHH